MKTTYCKNCNALRTLNKYGHCSGCGNPSEELQDDTYRGRVGRWDPWIILALRVLILPTLWLVFTLAMQQFICPDMTGKELLSRIPELITLNFETCLN